MIAQPWKTRITGPIIQRLGTRAVYVCSSRALGWVLAFLSFSRAALCGRIVSTLGSVADSSVLRGYALVKFVDARIAA